MEEGSADLRTPGSRNRSRYILINTLSSYGRDAVDTIIFLILIPFIIKTLGSESFGLWSLIWSFLAIFELADLGFGASVIKYVADARGRKDMERLRRIICTLFWIYAVLGVVVMSGIFASLLFFNRLFDIPPHQEAMARAVILILGVRSSLYLPLGMFRGVLVGYQKLSVANGYKVLGNLLYLIAVISILKMTPDIRMLAFINALTGLIPMVTMMIHACRMEPFLSMRPRYFERSLLMELSSFSLYFSFTQIAGLIATRADAMIIKLFFPLETVGIYSVGLRLAEKAGAFCSHLTRALTPVFAELHGSDEQSNVRAAYFLGSKLVIAFATPLLLGLGLLAKPLVFAWTGPDFAEAVPVCQWLTAAAMISIIHGNSVNVLSMGDRQRYVAISLLVGQLLNIVLSFLLIQPLGMVGVSMATFIAYIPTYVGLLQICAGRVHGITLMRFYKTTLFPSFVPAIAMAGALWGICRYWTLTNLLEVAIVEVLGIVVFGVVFWFVGFNGRERIYLTNRLRRVLGRGHPTKPTDHVARPEER